MAYDIGTARGVIEMEYNGRGIKEAQADLGNLEGKGERAGASLDKTSRNMGRAGLVVAAGLGLAINTAANFEQRMSAVEAVSGATAAEMDKLSDKALQLGADTSFSAGEAASAMEELVKAGLSVDDVLNGAADATVALAAAGEIALPEAATIASNALNQFGLKAKDLPNVADLIAGAANASAISVSDLGQSMQQAGAVANLAGVSFEDTATAIAIMGNAGIAGSDAGTSLKSMLSRLQPTTKKAATQMEELGLLTYDLADANKALAKITGQDAQDSIGGVTDALAEYVEGTNGGTIGTVKNADAVDKLLMKYGGLNNAFYDAEGNTKSLAKVSEVLKGSLKGMTAQQKQAALQTLFGSDAIRAAAILADNGAKGFNKLGDAMNKTTAAEVAAKRLDNFKGSLEAMKGSLETLGITMGMVLLPPLRALVEALTSVINWFSNLSSTTQKVIVGVLAFIAASLLIGAAILKIIIFINKARVALVALRGTLIATWLAALGPIALIIAAIALIGLAIFMLWKKSETFRTIVLAVFNAFKAAAAAVAAWFMGTFLPALNAVWEGIKSAVMTAFALIVGIIKVAIAVIGLVITTGLNAIKAVWTAVWGLFGPLVKAVFNLIVAVIRLAWTIIKGVTILAVRGIKVTVQAGFNAIKAVISSVMNGIRAVISAVWGFIGPYVKATVAAIKTAVTNAWNAIKSATSSVWNGLEPIVSGAIDGIMAIVGTVKEKILAAFDFASEMYAKGKAIIQGIIDGISSMINEVTAKINAITDAIASALPGSPVRSGPLKVLNKGYAGKQIVQMAIDGIVSMRRPLQAAVEGTMPATAVMGSIPPAAQATGRIKPKPSKDSEAPMSIQGTLEMVNGQAYITGIAVRAADAVNSENGRRGRMNYSG